MLWNNKQPRFGSLNLKIGSKIRYRPTPAGHDPGFPLVLRQKNLSKIPKINFQKFQAIFTNGESRFLWSVYEQYDSYSIGMWQISAQWLSKVYSYCTNTLPYYTNDTQNIIDSNDDVPGRLFKVPKIRYSVQTGKKYRWNRHIPT